MIYIKNTKINNVLINRYSLALDYLEESGLSGSSLKEAITYVDQDVLFIIDLELPDNIFTENYLKFHFTDQ